LLTVATLKTKKAYQVDLSALMAICETNYWRLRKLLLPIFPDLENNAKFLFSIPLAGTDVQRRLCMHVIERCPYTTTLEFSELKADEDDMGVFQNPWGLSPQLTVRIYHDAKTAEVISFQQQKNFLGRYEYPNALMRQQDEKFQLNNLLAEWLNHCLTYGYKESHVAVYTRLQ